MSAPPPPGPGEYGEQARVAPSRGDQATEGVKAVFLSISRQIAHATAQIAGSLEHLTQLPFLVGNVERTVATHFHRLYAHQVKVTAAGRLTAMQAAERKRRAALEALTEREAQLRQEREALAARYEKLLVQVARDAEARVRQLDSHAFDLLDQVYPRQVQQRFELDSTPAVKLLAEHADESAASRTLCLGEKLDSLAGAIGTAQKELATFGEQVHGLSTAEGPAQGWHRLSCYFVELEDAATGERRIEVVVERAGVLETLGPEVAAGLRERLDAGPEATLAPADMERLAEVMAENGAPTEDVRAFCERAAKKPIEWRGGGRA